MGLERVRIALLRGFDLPPGPLREEALEWVAEQEEPSVIPPAGPICWGTARP